MSKEVKEENEPRGFQTEGRESPGSGPEEEAYLLCLWGVGEASGGSG